MPEELVVSRGDPVYMAHGYLTKVPVPAVLPFIEAYTEPGDLVVDPFAGSGMTGVAAGIAGRRARLYDISVLGQHVGRNYMNLVDGDLARKQANQVVSAARERLGGLYEVRCAACDGRAELTKAVWSTVVRCAGCGSGVNYYRALEAAEWSKPDMVCPRCQAPITSRLQRIGEEPVADSITCRCSPTQVEQPSIAAACQPSIEGLNYPRVEIAPDRQMYQAQALGKSGRTTVDSFYSARNLAVLTVLREEIDKVKDEVIRTKLLFAFTASVTRASKRYQWSRKRPLNAANANYYVATVFYEWNVYELFLRKVEAVLRSDEWVRVEHGRRAFLAGVDLDVSYDLASAEHLPLPDASVDYVFTDPPFGSNLFYADMALFQEAWLDGFTDVTQEAVIRRGSARRASASRYEAILTNALSECRRVLKHGGRISMVFGNSTGSVWSLVQRAIAGARLVVEPEALVVLNKGQRSVKGLASGFEHVATLDLILTMRPVADGEARPAISEAPNITEVVRSLAAASVGASPSHLHLELLRQGFRNGWDLSTVDLRSVTAGLVADGWEVVERTGELRRRPMTPEPA